MPDEQLKYGNVIQIGPITIEVRGNNEKIVEGVTSIVEAIAQKALVMTNAQLTIGEAIQDGQKNGEG